MREARNHTLDAMRGVAALCVVLFHAHTLFGRNLAPHGYLAVDLFFALSGYVIARVYDARFADGLTPFGFIRRRLFRFYPLYLLGLAIGVVRELLVIVTHNPSAMAPATLAALAGAGALFLPMPLVDANLFALNAPSWSLLFELLVNIAYALVFPWLGRRVLSGIAVLSGLLLALAIVTTGTVDHGALIGGFALGTLRTLFSFTIGILLWRYRPAVPRVPAVLLLVAVAALLLQPFGGAAFDLAFVFLFSPLLVAAGTNADEPAALVPAFQYLGILSFPLYAVHRPMLRLAEGVQNIVPLPLSVLGVLCIAGLMIACPLLDRWYDRPVNRWLNRRFGGRADPARMAAP